jgi:hypothetical protein
MRKLYLWAAALALCAGTAAMLPSGRLESASTVDVNGAGGNGVGGDISSLNSGAYRDGLYLGRLTAERGRPHHVASGRWATAENRALFTAGYEQGYRESAASLPSANLPLASLSPGTQAAVVNSGWEIADCTSATRRRVACQPILN